MERRLFLPLKWRSGKVFFFILHPSFFILPPFLHPHLCPLPSRERRFFLHSPSFILHSSSFLHPHLVSPFEGERWRGISFFILHPSFFILHSSFFMFIYPNSLIYPSIFLSISFSSFSRFFNDFHSPATSISSIFSSGNTYRVTFRLKSFSLISS